jgi:hypothetical protein
LSAIGNYKSDDEVGGLVGLAENSTLSQIYTDVDIAVVDLNGLDSFGGVAGRLASSTIKDSYTTGSIKVIYPAGREYGQSVIAHSGGLAGRIEAASTVTNSYATGEIYGDHVGGLIGHLDTAHTLLRAISLSIII